MFKHIFYSLSLSAFFFVAEASAVMIDHADSVFNGLEVGGVDHLVGDANKASFKSALEGTGLKGSSPAAEAFWVSSLLGEESTFGAKTENVAYMGTDSENVYAFQLDQGPGYYVIKNSTHWALYENKGDLGWAVFDASKLNSGFNLGNDSFQISHVSEFGGVTPVPVPASLPLFALALAGVAWARRRFVNKS